MYLIIPLAVIVGAAFGIGYLLWRKWVFIRKLVPEPHETAQNMGNAYFPEFVTWAKGFDPDANRARISQELEKIIRKTRLAFLRAEGGFDAAIQNLRRSRISAPSVEAQPVRREPQVPNSDSALASEESVTGVSGVHVKSRQVLGASLRRREQQLIIAIARSPKNHTLYEKLGDLYIRMKEYGDAVESFKAALKLSPESRSLKEKLVFSRERFMTQQKQAP